MSFFRNKSGFERRLLLGAAVALFLLGLSGGLSYQNTTRLIQTSQWVTDTYASIAMQEELLARLTEAENGLFGYIITTEEDFLTPFTGATNRIQTLLGELRNAERDHPEQRQRVQLLETLVTQRLDYVHHRVQVLRAEGQDAAMALVRKREAKRVMDAIRETIAEMSRTERELLHERQTAALDRTRKTILFDIGFGVFSMLLLASIVLLLLTENQRRRRSEQSLQKARDELELRVQQRTANLAQANDALQAEIREHERAEAALRDSEERVRAIFQTAAEGIVTIDEHGVIESVNAAAERMFGYGPGELLGRKVNVLMPSPHAAEHDEYISRYLHTGEASIIGIGRETTGRRKDGLEFPVELSVSELKLEQKRLFTGFVRDITERKSAAEQVAKLAEVLADKNKELEMLLYIASHDLRSPLVNVQGFTRELAHACERVRALLKEVNAGSHRAELENWLGVEIPEAVEYVQAGVGRMDRLLSGFLRFSRLGRAAIKIERLNATSQFRSIGREMEYQLGQTGASLHIGSLPECLGDQLQTHQVFSNLLDNALKYLDPQRPGKIEVAGWLENGCAIYSIKDNGIGIEPALQGKVFEIFQRLNDATASGEGLGLTIAQRILQRQNGRIWVESAPGQGSTFYVCLPAADSIGPARCPSLNPS